MIIADENIDGRLILKLRETGFEIVSIKESFRGYSDREIIQMAKSPNSILITEDKDFGEWVFSHNVRGYTVILLRYHNIFDFNVVEKNVIEVLQQTINKPGHRFITITKHKIRIREI